MFFSSTFEVLRKSPLKSQISCDRKTISKKQDTFFSSLPLGSNKTRTKFLLWNKARPKFIHFCHITNSRARNNSV